MLDMLADKAVAVLVRENAIKKEDSDIYVYGAHLVFSSIIGWLLVICVGALLGHFWLGVLFLCYVVPTRSYCGGYHADSYLLCNTVFSGTFALTAIAYLFLASKGWLWAAVPFNLFSMAAAVVFAPVENSSRPLIEGEKKKFKIISILIFAVFSVISFALIILKQQIGLFFSTALFAVSMLMIIGIIKERRKNNEKSNKKSC